MASSNSTEILSWIDDHSRYALSVRGSFVHLGICEGQALDRKIPSNDLGLATSFLRAGASAVVASTFRIFDQLAAEFGPKLAAELIEGRTIAHAFSEVIAGEATSISGLRFNLYVASPTDLIRIVGLGQ